MYSRDEVRNLSAKLIGLVTLSGLFIISFGYLLELVISQALPDISPTVKNTGVSLLVLFLGVSIVRASLYVLGLIQSKFSVLTVHQKEMSYRFVQISVYVSSILYIVSSVWSINLSDVLLGAGVLGVVVGLSARQGLSSVISGIIILGTNIFRVGEWVQFDGNFGRVTDITFFNTKFRSPQGEVHVVPNEALTSQSVTNVSRGKYRVDLLVGVDYSVSIDRVVSICDSEMSSLKKSDENGIVVGFQPTSVKEFDDSSIVLALKVWVDNPTPTMINQAKTMVFSAVHERFKKEDMQIPFPQITISDRSD
jgi:small-conductance mechanosensitive channel